jgi:hypothetical protein
MSKRQIRVGDRVQSVNGARGKVVALATISDGQMTVRDDFGKSSHHVDDTQIDGSFVRVHWDHAEHAESSFTALELVTRITKRDECLACDGSDATCFACEGTGKTL